MRQATSIDSKEGSMSNKVRGWFMLVLGAALIAVVGLVSSGQRPRRLGSGVRHGHAVNEYGWPGSTANTYVAK